MNLFAESGSVGILAAKNLGRLLADARIAGKLGGQHAKHDSLDFVFLK